MPLTLHDVLDLLPELATRYHWQVDDLGLIRAPTLVPLLMLRELDTRDHWPVDDLGLIRAPTLAPLLRVGHPRNPAQAWFPQVFSPLTALTYALTGLVYEPWMQWDAAASVIDLPYALASELVAAEDGDSPHSRPLRQALLKALGLG